MAWMVNSSIHGIFSALRRAFSPRQSPGAAAGRSRWGAAARWVAGPRPWRNAGDSTDLNGISMGILVGFIGCLYGIYSGMSNLNLYHSYIYLVDFMVDSWWIYWQLMVLFEAAIMVVFHGNMISSSIQRGLKRLKNKRMNIWIYKMI